MDSTQPFRLPDDSELEPYAARTRRSLIERLHNWQDQKSWDDFYRTYWRLIYGVATKAGLNNEEAWDVVQETILSVAKQTRDGRYDAEKGSFKNWLWTITRWRIADQFRKRPGAPCAPDSSTCPGGEPADKLPDTMGETFEKIWEREWQLNRIKAAAERVKMRVNPRQFQIFDCYVLRGMSTAEVRRTLGVSTAQIYLTRHRVGKLLRQELEYINSLDE